MTDGEDNTKSDNNTSFTTNINSRMSNISNYKIIQNDNKWTKKLLQYFKTINSIDNSIEKIRIKLNSQNNFSSTKLFNYLDKESKKYINLNDFKTFLQNNQISFAEKNLRKFIHNFDKDNDFSLNYKEFLGIISPKKDEIKTVKKTNDEETGTEDNNLVSDEIKRLFGELISEELNFVEKCYEASKNVRNCNEFTTYEAFREIVGDEKYINVVNLGNYLKNKGLGMTDVEINQLMFRIDSDHDGMISYEEFKDIFLPLNDINFKYNDYNKTNSYIDYYNENQYEQYNDQNINNYKNNLPLKIPKLNLNINNNYYSNENKENNKNEINIDNKYNYNTNIENENIDIKDSNITNNNEIEDMPNISYSLYDDKSKNNKSIIIDTQNKEKDKPKEDGLNLKNTISLLSSINDNKKIKKYYTNSNNTNNNNTLLNQTKSILNYNNNNYSQNINNNNDNKDYNIIENKENQNDYDSSFIMKSPLKNEIKYEKKRNVNKNKKGEKFLDTYLNFDYSKYKNKDYIEKYYFKKINKNENELFGKNKNEEKKNNLNYNKNYNSNIESKYINNSFINYKDNESNYFHNNNSMYNNEFILENIIKTRKANNSMNYNLNNINNLKNKKNNYKERNKYKYIIEESYYQSNNNNINNSNDNDDYSDNSINQYKMTNNYNKYILNSNNIKNNSYYKKIKINQNKLNVNNSLRNNYILHNHNIKQNKSEQQQYLDSLENSGGFHQDQHSQIFKKSKYKYHYNTKLTRNLKDQIHNRINSSYKMNTNNSMINFNYKDNEKKFNKTYFEKERNNNHNRSCIISNDNNKNDLFDFDIDNKYNKNKINHHKDKNMQICCSSCIAKRCPRCNCIQATISVIDDDNNNYEKYYNDNKIIYNNNSNKKIIKRNSQHSSLPKNIFKKATNLNYNNSMNTKSYYIESSQKNNNFIINKINYKSNNSNINLKKIEPNNNNNNKYIPFYNLLMDFIKQDNSIEITRQLLSTRDDINLTDLFELFDHSSNQIISSIDFLQTLKEFGLFLNIDEIKFLFRKFNKNINEFFEYEEFCEIFLPKKYSSAKIMSEKQQSEYFKGLSQETKKIICRLFNNIIEGEKSNENYRKIMGVNKDYSGFNLFNKIKKNYSIGIYKEDISNFMKKNKHRLSNGEIELLMDRFDKNKDGMIDYKEFINEITPMN